jgi:hypothetical protein
MSFGWWTILDTHRKLLSVTVEVQFLNLMCLAHSLPEWNTYTIHVSILKNLSLTALLPISYTLKGN